VSRDSSSRPKPSRTIQFSAKVLEEVAAALSPGAPPERVALLPQILRAWAHEDLREHLSRQSRAAARKHAEQLRSIATLAQGLIDAFVELPPDARFLAALRPELHRTQQTLLEVTTASSIEVARRRFDEGITWLTDLAKALREPQPKEPPKATRNHLIILDLAAIFQLVGGKQPTRRTNSDTGKDYGPFWDFASAIWPVVFGNRSGLSAAIKQWATEDLRQRELAEAAACEAANLMGRDLTSTERCAVDRRFGEYSSFVANLQFRHPCLWQKLTASQQQFRHWRGAEKGHK
jgi:hypothetical protein